MQKALNFIRRTRNINGSVLNKFNERILNIKGLHQDCLFWLIYIWAQKVQLISLWQMTWETWVKDDKTAFLKELWTKVKTLLGDPKLPKRNNNNRNNKNNLPLWGHEVGLRGRRQRLAWKKIKKYVSTFER